MTSTAVTATAGPASAAAECGQSPASAIPAAALAYRSVRRIFESPSQKEGAGFIVQRPLPMARFLPDELADPFLLFDEFGPIDAPKNGPGAPWHPHRGFDTVTYLKAGEGRHADSMGNEGIIRAGEVQWMRAGSGVIHDEGRDHPGGLMHGFQLWVNLPRAKKMSDPQYQQLSRDTLRWVPLTSLGGGHQANGARVKIIAGEMPTGPGQISRSPFAHLEVPVLYADVEVQPGGIVDVVVPSELDTCVLYIYSGSGRVFDGAADTTGAPVRRKDCVVVGSVGTAIRVLADQQQSTAPTVGTSESGGSGEPVGLAFMLLSGKALKEPIARHGPFVMNTQEELQQAFADYRAGTLVKVKAGSKVH